MAKSSKNGAINQKNDTSMINSRRGMAKCAKRNSSKRDRQILKKETTSMFEESLRIKEKFDIKAKCPDCETPHKVLKSGKTEPVCICHLICDICGGRKVFYELNEDCQYPYMSGEWCVECGPFEDYYD